MVQTAEKTGSKSALNGVESRFKPGNPGRPKGAKDIRGLLDAALKAAAKLRAELREPCLCVLPDPASYAVLIQQQARESDKAHTMRVAALETSLWKRSCRTADQHFARRLYSSDTVLIAFQKKRLPDLQHQTGVMPPTNISILYGHQSAPRVQVAEAMPTGDGNGHG